ncbi:hypothetical protein KJ991_02110 [Patescibacteria group bacterium]|nr:hypothetical protein [Patescibacteria group bacterium]MBU4057465.1 hypothetical protein [Patescibacteria group bacterium]MBU4115664.1 hypothetical protein [Patescibacteria group bacterium]
MDFKNISDLLDKYKNILPSDRIIKDALVSVSSGFGIELKKENIKISRGVVYINSDFITKSKIFVNKIEIMKGLKEVLGKKTPKDII